MDADEPNEADRDLRRRAAWAKRENIASTVLDGLQLEQLAQYPGHQSGHWVTAAVLLLRLTIRWWPRS